MNVGICDDETIYINQIANQISRYSFFRNIDIHVKTYTNLQDLSVDVKSLDIIFLDIRFDGENLGIEWARKLRERNDKTIIVIYTSLKDAAIYGYAAEPIRFLEKPVSDRRLFNVMDLCSHRLNTASERLVVVSNSDNVFIRVSNIVLIKRVHRLYDICLEDKTVISTYENLRALNLRINRPDQFKYSNKSCIVNLEKVKYIANYTLFMTNESCVPLSKSFSPQFRKDLVDYMGGRT